MEKDDSKMLGTRFCKEALEVLEAVKKRDHRVSWANTVEFIVLEYGKTMEKGA